MAATLTRDGELTYVSIPIEKTEETPDGDLLVYGKATDGTVDSDEQIVDLGWSGSALQDWLDSGGNVRVQHNAQRDPAGKGLKIEVTPDGHYVKSLVVEPVAKRLVRKGVLRAYSVGIRQPVIERDMTGKARGGLIKGGEIFEISLVDRPANSNCGFTLAKSDAGGTPRWVGKMFGAGEMTSGSATVILPDDLRLPLTAGDLARIEQHHKERVQRTSFNPADMAKIVNSGGASVVKGQPAAVKRDMDPDVGGGVDRDKLPAKDFAGRHRSFPIVQPGDVSDAASSIGQAGEDNYSPDKLRENITRIARRKGPEFVAELPESWREGKKAAKPDAEPGEGKDRPFAGAAPEFGSKKPKKGKKKPKPKAEAEATKSDGGDRACGKCGHEVGDGAKFCPNCGAKLTGGQGDGDGGEGAASKAASPKAKDKKTKPVPAHREPDGPQTEILERDAHMEDGDESREGTAEPTPTWDKSAALHDVLCPAYRLADARAAHGLKSLRAAVHADWADAGLRDLAAALRTADKAAVKGARRQLRKSFTAMYPSVHVTPADMTPGRFNRPYISAGHAPASAVKPGKQLHAGVDYRQIDAADFGRGPLTGGHERPSPGSSKNAAGYGSAVEAQAAAAVRALHDHVAVTRPELCPLAHTPAHAVGQGVPARKAAKTGKAKKALRKQSKTIRRLEKRLGELASQPDPNAAPVRGILSKNASGGAGPVDRRSLVDEANERDADYVRYLKGVAGSGDPVQREQARAVLTKMQH